MPGIYKILRVCNYYLDPSALDSPAESIPHTLSGTDPLWCLRLTFQGCNISPGKWGIMTCFISRRNMLPVVFPSSRALPTHILNIGPAFGWNQWWGVYVTYHGALWGCGLNKGMADTQWPREESGDSLKSSGNTALVAICDVLPIDWSVLKW